MKWSYIKLLFFMFFFSLLFILNSLVFKVLSTWMLCFILLIMIGIGYFLFGYERHKYRYVKEIGLEIGITLLVFFLVYYLMGIFIGFARSSNVLSISMFIGILIPSFIYIVLRELLRNKLVLKASNSRVLVILVGMFFMIMDFSIPFSSHILAFNREMFLLLAITIMPLITENILCTYISYNYGYKPCLVYLGIMYMFRYAAIIIPNPNEYLYSIVFFLLPLVVMYRIMKWGSRDRTDLVILREYKKRKGEFVLYLVPSVITVIVVYFVSGYFRYYAIAVASGSMEDVISKGDVVIVDTKYDGIDMGDIIAYRYDNKIVVHRVFKKLESGNAIFIYTKGDANRDYDKYKISKDMIVGVVRFKVPFIGYPTVLLNEKW